MAASAFELPEDKRDNKRQRLFLSARMEDAGGTHEVHLLNVSGTGAKLDAEEVPVQGETVTLICAGMRIEARVAWVDDTRFGIAFTMPIDASALIARGQSHLAG